MSNYEEIEVKRKDLKLRFITMCQYAEFSERRILAMMHYIEELCPLYTEFLPPELENISLLSNMFTNEQPVAPGIPGNLSSAFDILNQIPNEFTAYFNQFPDYFENVALKSFHDVNQSMVHIRKKANKEIERLQGHYNKQYQDLMEAKAKSNDLYIQITKAMERMNKSANKSPKKQTSQSSEDELRRILTDYQASIKHQNIECHKFNVIYHILMDKMFDYTAALWMGEADRMQKFQKTIQSIFTYCHICTPLNIEKFIGGWNASFDLQDFVKKNGIVRSTRPLTEFVPVPINGTDYLAPTIKRPIQLNSIPLSVAIAIHSFQGETKYELSFNKGDRLLLYDNLNRDWVLASVGNDEHIGYAPTGALKLEKRPLAIVLRPNVIDQPEMLSVHAGETVVTEYTQEEMFTCTNTNNDVGKVKRSDIQFDLDSSLF